MELVLNIPRYLIPKSVRTQLRQFWKYIKSYVYWGYRYECPFCKGRFRKLMRWGRDNPVARDLVGGGAREVMCPRCYSTDRERLIYFYLKFKTDLFQRQDGFTLLHVSPERNLERMFLEMNHTGIEYIPAELFPRNQQIRMDITDIQFRDNVFDGIICNHVLEHVPEDRRAMAELHRVLKPGGWAILQCPVSRTREATYEDPGITDPKERERHFGQKDHVRIYAWNDYVRRLEAAGFAVEQHRLVEEVGKDFYHHYALNPEEVVFFCRKNA